MSKLTMKEKLNQFIISEFENAKVNSLNQKDLGLLISTINKVIENEEKRKAVNILIDLGRDEENTAFFVMANDDGDTPFIDLFNSHVEQIDSLNSVKSDLREELYESYVENNRLSSKLDAVQKVYNQYS